MFPKDSLLKMTEDGKALSSASAFYMTETQDGVGVAPVYDTTIVTPAESGSVDIVASADNVSVDNARQTTTEGQRLSSSETVTVLLDDAAAAADESAADVPVVQSIDNNAAATETISPSNIIALSPQGPIPSTQTVSAPVFSSLEIEMTLDIAPGNEVDPGELYRHLLFVAAPTLIRRTTGSQGALVSFLPGGGRNSTLATLTYTGDRSLVVNPELLTHVVSAVAVAVSSVQNGGGNCPGCGAPHA